MMTRWEQEKTLNNRIKNAWAGSWLRRLLIIVRWHITSKCGQNCDWQVMQDYDSGLYYYVFIPEADCPIHDNEETTDDARPVG